MAYAASGLTRLGGDSNGSLWRYTTTDAIATVNTANYFNDAANMLAVDVSDGTAVAKTDGD